MEVHDLRFPKKGILLSSSGVETEALRFKQLTHSHMTEEQSKYPTNLALKTQ